MNVASLCCREIVGIEAGATLRDAAILMCEQHVGALVVVTSDTPPQVVGIVTDRDLAIEGLGRSGDPSDLNVGHLAKSPPVAVAGSASLHDAAGAMERAGVRRLLVVDGDGGVVGVIAADDLLQAVSEELEGLARALRANIHREQSQRKVFPASPVMRPIFPRFGTAGLQ